MTSEAVAEVNEVETIVTLPGGGQVICRGTAVPESLRVGDRCQVGLRPEHMHIGGPAETDAFLTAAGRWHEEQRVTLTLRPEDLRLWRRDR